MKLDVGLAIVAIICFGLIFLSIVLDLHRPPVDSVETNPKQLETHEVIPTPEATSKVMQEKDVVIL